ncbi:MAG TPA: MogA/MoaB family molybdenum cofactor biosynthesis protein [Methanosarcinaceae archaeon]|nr:MogA/MoaB family molybdenum cofactor biosynthesis protein [Methanosarcinaceae archaeon]
MNESSTHQHKKNTHGPYNFFLVTISTSRAGKYGDVTKPEDAEDISGQVMRDIIIQNGHHVLNYSLISDEINEIRDIANFATNTDADIIITSGGTGLASRDVTIESIAPMLDKEMPGFGELFRHKSIRQIGTSVILTRAIAGVANNKAIFCLPGSPNAARLALEEIIMPETGHIVKHTKE